MRYGFTTGSCAAAAAKAAAYMLLSGKDKENISILTPKGIWFHASLVHRTLTETQAQCGVVKDGGDDPDITTGSIIFAKVEYGDNDGIEIDGGEGVGRVTKPGLDQPVGNAAINHVPREMIEREVRQVCEALDYTGGLRIIIHVPGGEELAQKTFNPRLGIVGGISILGTSGIVEPMSSQALLDTIAVECNQKKAMGAEILAVAPGNYGMDFMKNTYGYSLEDSVKCSNFIGDTIEIAIEKGFDKMLLTGHIGKLVKVAGGIMNTHSKEGDCRMELLACAALRAGGTGQVCRDILDSVTTEEGIRILQEASLVEPTMKYLCDKIKFYLDKKAAERITVEVMVYSNEYGLLGKSEGAEAFLQQLLIKDGKQE